MLLLSENPPRAAICDYDKTIKAEVSRDTHIGPIHTLAPEVWTAAESGYTRSIDVWAFGYTIADILGYRPGAPYPRISLDRHKEILDKLRTHAERVPEDEGVVDLAIRMLAWNPSQQLTAAEALEQAVGLLSGLRNLDLELVDEYMAKQETPKKPWCVLHSKAQ